MKTKIITGFVFLILVFLNIYQCSKPLEVRTIEVEIPAIVGDFEYAKPVQREINVDSILSLVKDTLTVEFKVIERAVKANDSLEKKYLALEDEFERFKLFQEFISVRKFEHTFEDDNLIANISGINRGMIEAITIDYYEIKKRKQNVKIQTARKKRFGIGPGIGYDFLTGNVAVGAYLTYGIIRF